MHGQMGKVLGLGLEILALAAQASGTEELGIGDDPFGVGEMGGGKVEIEVGVSVFEEGRSGERDIY